MRGGYSPAGDLVQAIGDAAEQLGRTGEAEGNLATTKALVARIEELRMWNAGNLAEKTALRKALAKIAPDHPLLTNADLQERIKEAGRRALVVAENWDAVREAASTFKID